MLIKTLVVGQIDTNCYIVTDEATLSCAVIDPGDESNIILDYIEDNKLRVEAILLTHGHFDHRMAADTVSEETGAPVWVHRRDAVTDGYDRFKYSAAPSTRYYAEGDTVSVGSLTFTVLETPGHSPGSVTLRCEDVLFTGDTLFRGSCGRTDLGGGNMQALLNSLSRLDGLDGNFEVYPGHMDPTSLDRERRFNEYMEYAREEYGTK
jgi:glyoxylase-like metal-dependent hydrolase (beta-lactamase superfamily II)